MSRLAHVWRTWQTVEKWDAKGSTEGRNVSICGRTRAANRPPSPAHYLLAEHLGSGVGSSNGATAYRSYLRFRDFFLQQATKTQVELPTDVGTRIGIYGAGPSSRCRGAGVSLPNRENVAAMGRIELLIACEAEKNSIPALRSARSNAVDTSIGIEWCDVGCSSAATPEPYCHVIAMSHGDEHSFRCLAATSRPCRSPWLYAVMGCACRPNSLFRGQS